MIVKVINDPWLLDIDLQGGRISELHYQNQIILGTFDRIDGKKGNTHLCVPNFGAEGKELDLPFHGPARNERWKIIKQTNDSLTITWEMLPTEKYPGHLIVEQEFILEDGFKQTVNVMNRGKTVPVNLGIHNYWATPNGLENASVNGIDITTGIETNNSIKVKNKNEIIFSGMKPIIWELDGFNDAVLWTGFKREGEKTIYDQKYCCIEPVRSYDKNYFGSERSLLKTGKSFPVSQQIGLLM
jgi:galactose mutarotase-like enzyme